MIELTRGDTKKIIFKRVKKSDGSVITEKPEKMFFTIKYDSNVEELVIQKTFDNGILFDENEYQYRITIKPEDTDNLPYGNYKCDIEIIDGVEKHTIFKDTLKLTEEVTFASNENGEIIIDEYDYNSSINKPRINDVELVGNKTLQDLGIQQKGDYALKEDIPDVSGINHDIENLTELIKENQDNIKKLEERIQQLETAKQSNNEW